MTRYIVADPDDGPGWSHIWRIQDAAGASIDVERACRFAFDRRAARLVQLDIDVGGIMMPASDAQVDDLLDSLLNANFDAIEDPGSHGLSASRSLPKWCRKARKGRDAPAKVRNRPPDLLSIMMDTEKQDKTVFDCTPHDERPNGD